MVNGMGSYGVAIQNSEDNEEKITTWGERIWGSPGTFNSYRYEANGIATCLIVHKQRPRIIACNNATVVEKLKSPTPLGPLTPEWDVLEPARKIIAQENIEVRWLKGHQDDIKK